MSTSPVCRGKLGPLSVSNVYSLLSLLSRFATKGKSKRWMWKTIRKSRLTQSVIGFSKNKPLIRLDYGVSCRAAVKMSDKLRTETHCKASASLEMSMVKQLSQCVKVTHAMKTRGYAANGFGGNCSHGMDPRLLSHSF